MTRRDLERAALAAHRAGDDWQTFWPDVADAVATMNLDYYERGRLIHKLVGLVASGDTDGARPVDAGYARPFDFETDNAAAAPIFTPHDTLTAAKVNWQAAGVVPVNVGGHV